MPMTLHTRQTCQDRKLRVLALVPPDKTGRTVSRFTFFREELDAFSAAGVEIHTISEHTDKRVRINDVTLHPIPRIRDLGHTLNSLTFFRRSLIPHKSLSDRLLSQLKIARYDSAIASVLREQDIDIVYSPFAWPQSTAGVNAAHHVGVPVVASLRGADGFSVPEINYGLLERRPQMAATLQQADHVIGVCRGLADSAISMGAPADRVSVVWQGVHLENFSPGNRADSRRKLNLNDRPTVLFVGNFVPVKGIATLLAAFDHLIADMPQVQLVMCGTGSELERIEHFRNERPDVRRVILPGRVSRESIPDYFRAADVFVLPSLSEGGPNVLVEAAACGLPAVGSIAGGIPDYIDDNVTGLLFESQNAEQLAEKLKYMLQHPELAEQMGRAGRERAIEQFGYQQMINNLLNVFEETVTAFGADNRPQTQAVNFPAAVS